MIERRGSVRDKKTYIKRHFLFIIGLSTILLALLYNWFLIEDESLDALIQKNYPEITKIEKINSDPLAYKVYKDSKFVAYGVVGEATGYQSQVKIFSLIDLKGVLLSSFVVQQNETPSFFQRIVNEHFLEEFNDKPIKEGFEVGSNIDATTGATVSSTAITKAINRGIKYIGDNQLEMKVNNPYSKVEFGAKELVTILFLAFAVYASYKCKAKIRTYVLLFSIIVMGFWLNMFITYNMFASVLLGLFPSIENIGWYVLFFGTIFVILVTSKNIYCVWMCPFGGVQELLYKIGFKGLRISPHVMKYMRKVPGFLAWFAIMLGILKDNPKITNYEPFSTFFSQIGTDIQWILLPIIIFTSLFTNRFYCGNLCPVGYTLNLIVKLRQKGAKLWGNQKKLQQKI